LKKKPLNRHISATVRQILMTFGIVTRVERIPGLSEKNQRLWSVAAGKSEVLEEGVVLDL